MKQYKGSRSLPMDCTGTAPAWSCGGVEAAKTHLCSDFVLSPAFPTFVPMLGNSRVTLLRDKSLNFMPEGQFLSLSLQFPPISSLLPERKINDFAGGKGEISSRIKTHEQNTHVTVRRICFACKYHPCKVKMSHFAAALALGTE